MLFAIDDAAFRPIRTYLKRDPIADHYFDIVKAHLACQIGKNFLSFIKLDPKLCIGQRLNYGAFFFQLFV